MKKQLCLFSFAFAMASNIIATNLAFDEHTLFKQADEKAQWSFVEKKFITDIAASKQLTWTHVSNVIPAAVLIGTGIDFMEQKDLTVKIDLLTKVNIYKISMLLASTLMATQFTECIISHRANRAAIQDFFSHWDQNKNYVPAELFEAFQLIADTMESEGEEVILKSANEIIDAIQFIVTRHFDARYKNILEIKAANALADVKTFGEIIKNTIETTGKFGGK
ncbi:MAG: hypothetical protein JO129_00875 [Candidatus Dependentiae bacterium]|nr:hypothetical protein [Candidatus Dependentiae bacterium]